MVRTAGGAPEGHHIANQQNLAVVKAKDSSMEQDDHNDFSDISQIRGACEQSQFMESVEADRLLGGEAHHRNQ
jgi:hypothetical protein